MTIVSIHQPIYLPWLAYFDKIRRSDIHVVLDTVTVGKADLCNRNKIRTPTGWQWLTIPIKNKGSRSTPIGKIETVNDDWRDSHLGLIRAAYSEAKYFSRYIDEVRFWYECTPSERLLSHTAPIIHMLLHFFKINKPKIVYAHQLQATGHKSDLNLNICKELGATTYLSGPYGRDYLDIPKFNASGIDVQFTDYKHPMYRQQPYLDFVPGMSALDALFNCGEWPE